MPAVLLAFLLVSHSRFTPAAVPPAAVTAVSAPSRVVVDLDQGWQFAKLPVSTPEAAPKATADQATPKAAAKTTWESQYNISRVQLGDARFDLKGQALEAIKGKELQHLDSVNAWQAVSLPHTPEIEPKSVTVLWQGVCYYKRSLAVPTGWRGKRVVLTLGAAMQVSDVWLNGDWVGGRRGGYLPVVIDLTQKLRPKTSNQIVVRLDNTDNPLVPPGKPWHDLDFCYFGGLYRDAYLTVTDPVHVTDPILAHTPAGGGVFVTYPTVTAAKAVVDVQTQVANLGARAMTVRLVQTLRPLNGGIHAVQKSGGKAVLSTQSAFTIPAGGTIQPTQSIAVAQPRLWSPESPSRYRLTTVVYHGQQEVDRVETTIGIRSIKFTRDQGLLLNGKPLELVGTNRHQEYPYIGNALSRYASYRDMYLIKGSGFNCVRLSHYPQDPAVMEACDKLGILTIPAIPGWQFVNSDPRFMGQVDSDIHDLIRLHRNHPCALMWEASLNETYPSKAIATRWYTAAHQEFKGSNFYAVGDSGKGLPWDIAYNSWWDSNHTRPQNDLPNEPGYIREYGDWEFGGANSTSRVERSLGEEGELQQAWNFAWSHNRNRAQRPWTVGDGTWVMYDYNRGYDPRIEASGMANIFRIPRMSALFFMSQQDVSKIGGFVYLATAWTPSKSGNEAPTRKVVVFSNGDEVKLELNGKVIATQKPDSGPDTEYGDYDHGGKPWDGGNARHLKHPAFTFFNVPWQPGHLEAIAFQHGTAIGFSEHKTPGAAKQLDLYAATLGINLHRDGADAIFIYAPVLDANGQQVVNFDGEVTFHCSGPIRIVGPSTVHAEAGVAAILIQGVYQKPGAKKVKAVVTVSGAGLTGRQMKID